MSDRLGIPLNHPSKYTLTSWLLALHYSSQFLWILGNLYTWHPAHLEILYLQAFLGYSSTTKLKTLEPKLYYAALLTHRKSSFNVTCAFSSLGDIVQHKYFLHQTTFSVFGSPTGVPKRKGTEGIAPNKFFFQFLCNPKIFLHRFWIQDFVSTNFYEPPLPMICNTYEIFMLQ